MQAAIMWLMKIASWNVNGIRSVYRKGLFQVFMNQVKPDVLCLQETKAERGQIEVDLPLYEEYWHSSTRKKGYAGTAIFSKIKPLSVSFGFPPNILESFSLSDSYGDPNAEGRVMAAEFETYFLVNVYTPNAKPDLSRLGLRHSSWDPAFLTYLRMLQKQKPVVFCGDLNVAHTPLDLANPKANEGEHGFTQEEREGIDRLVAAGFVDTFRLFHKSGGHYTWWSNFSNARARNIGWRIDYFFASQSLVPHITHVDIRAEFIGSDHCPIILELRE